MGKHAKVEIWKKYKIEGDKVVRDFDLCPKCKTGILAKMPSRRYCGYCGYAEIQKQAA